MAETDQTAPPCARRNSVSENGEQKTVEDLEEERVNELLAKGAEDEEVRPRSRKCGGREVRPPPGAGAWNFGARATRGAPAGGPDERARAAAGRRARGGARPRPKRVDSAGRGTLDPLQKS